MIQNAILGAMISWLLVACAHKAEPQISQLELRSAEKVLLLAGPAERAFNSLGLVKGVACVPRFPFWTCADGSDARTRLKMESARIGGDAVFFVTCSFNDVVCVGEAGRTER
jgi:hypothetical protein